MEEKWERLRSCMERIRAKQEFCLLQGDLNKLVGQGKFGVEGNHQEVSLGGKLLLDLLATGNWFLVNGLGQDIVEGGPFTRKDPATGNKSCLDLFIVSRELLPFVKKLEIDSEQELAVGRAVKRGQNYEIVNSDHFTCFLTLSGLPRIQERKEENQVIWNLASEGGWERYRIISDKFSESLEKVIDNKEIYIEEKMKQFERIHDRIKHHYFRKTRISKKAEKKAKN